MQDGVYATGDGSGGGWNGITALPSDCWGYSCVRSGIKITGADIGIYSIYSIVKIKVYYI